MTLHSLARLLPPPLRPSRIPSYLISGINVAVGLTLVAMAAYLLGGVAWALGAALGAVVTSMPDQVGRPDKKIREVLPGTLLGAAMYLVTLLTHAHPWMLLLALVVGSFVAVLPQAWGKRGMPLSFSMMFGLVIPLAAPPITGLSLVFLETALFIAGGLAYIAYTSTTARWLDRRYRELALADCTDALARLIRLQVESMREGVEPGTASMAAAKLVAEQTAWSDRLQTARDLVFHDLRDARRRQLAALLFNVIEVRDQLLTCQLDLDLLMASRRGRRAVPALASRLDSAAVACETITKGLRHGAHEVAAAIDLNAPAARADALQAPRSEAGEPLVVRVVRDRIELLVMAVSEMTTALVDPTSAPPLREEDLQLFTTPDQWSWHYLKERLRWRSPVLRYALRTSLAMAAAYGIAEALPWAAHKHWILVSVAVVLRSSYAQTSERRKLRLIGTAIGCLVAALLLATTDNRVVIFLALVIAAGAAHGFAVSRYTVTAASGSVMGLLQTHLMAPYAGFVVWERLIDTMLGIALAWAFSFVLPSWERHQVPAQIKRVLQSQARYVQLTLAQYRQPGLTLDWRLARREVYDAMAALALGLQRMQSEPRQVRLALPALASLQAHAHELMAHLAAVKAIISLRRDNLDPVAAEAALERSASVINSVLTGIQAAVATAPVPTPRPGAPAGAPAAPVDEPDEPDEADEGDNDDLRGRPAYLQPQLEPTAMRLLPPTDVGDLTAWLVRRLDLAEQQARLLVAAAVPLGDVARTEPAQTATPGSATAATGST